MFSAPFLLLLLAETACAIGAHIADSRRGVATSLSVATVAAALLTALLLWLVGAPAARDESAGRLAITAIVALALLLPFLPAWMVHL